MSLRIYEFEFLGINRKTKEEKVFKAIATWSGAALDKLKRLYGKQWEFKYL
jgi:hypothetical protein